MVHEGGGEGRGEGEITGLPCAPSSGVSLDPSGWGIVVTSSTVLLWRLSGSKASCVCVCSERMCVHVYMFGWVS